METTSEANSRPAANQENAGNAAKPTDQNLGQTEPTATTGQGVISSPESSTPAPVQSVAKTQETPSPEKNTPAESKRAVKSSASSNKRAPVTPVSKAPLEESTAISTPPPPVVELVAVPDLTGTQLNVAKSILSLNGLKVGAVSTIPDPRNDGMVMRQVPKPGTQLKKGSTVNLILGSK